MIDAKTGTLQFEHLDIVVGRGLREDIFLRSLVGQRAKRLVHNPPHTSWGVEKLRLAGREVGVGFYFLESRLWRVALSLSDARFGSTWEDWSEERELARQAEHDAWLEPTLGRARQFSWGKVSSSYDKKSGGSDIWVLFEG